MSPLPLRRARCGGLDSLENSAKGQTVQGCDCGQSAVPPACAYRSLNFLSAEISKLVQLCAIEKNALTVSLPNTTAPKNGSDIASANVFRSFYPLSIPPTHSFLATSNRTHVETRLIYPRVVIPGARDVDDRGVSDCGFPVVAVVVGRAHRGEPWGFANCCFGTPPSGPLLRAALPRAVP